MADNLQNTPIIFSFKTVSTFLCVCVCVHLFMCANLYVCMCVETRGQHRLLVPRVLTTLFSKTESVAGLELVGWAEEAA